MPEPVAQQLGVVASTSGRAVAVSAAAVTLPPLDADGEAAQQNVRCPWIKGIPHTQPCLQRFRRFLDDVANDYPASHHSEHFASFAASADGSFIVYAKNWATAQAVADAAPRIYHNLSMEWFGARTTRPLEPFVIAVCEDSSVGAGGSTQMYHYAKDPTEFVGCYMQGSKERILDSVLPHELTHALTARHFNRPVPRWADEGIATLPEHPSETIKRQNGVEALVKNNTARPAAEIFARLEYPNAKEVLPFYDQGYSLSKFLIARGEAIEKIEQDGIQLSGKRRFTHFLQHLIDVNSNPVSVERTLKELYGFKSMKALDESWKWWVKNESNPMLALTTLDASQLNSPMYQYRPPALGTSIAPSASASAAR